MFLFLGTTAYYYVEAAEIGLVYTYLIPNEIEIAENNFDYYW